MKAISELSLAVFSLKNFNLISEHYPSSIQIMRKHSVFLVKENSERLINKKSTENLLKQTLRTISLDLNHKIKSKNHIKIKSTIPSFSELKGNNENKKNKLSYLKNSKKVLRISHRKSEELINGSNFSDLKKNKNTRRKSDHGTHYLNLNASNYSTGKKLNFHNFGIYQKRKLLNVFKLKFSFIFIKIIIFNFAAFNLKNYGEV